MTNRLIPPASGGDRHQCRWTVEDVEAGTSGELIGADSPMGDPLGAGSPIGVDNEKRGFSGAGGTFAGRGCWAGVTGSAMRGVKGSETGADVFRCWWE